MPPRKVLLILFFVSSGVSFLRLLRIMVTTTTSSSPPSPLLPPPTPALPLRCSCPPSMTAKHFPANIPRHRARGASSDAGTLTSKELRLLSTIISLRAPCNLLFFGLRPELLALSGGLNAGGRTVFLEDDIHSLRTAAPPDSQSVHVYRVKYNATASRAYDLLRRARADPACQPDAAGDLRASACQLALSWLPNEVYERHWDVIVVDGPSGDRPEAPGRMAAIYSAAVMARTGRATDVLVHDVDRTVEKWYSWEYLCHENQASAKGKLWHFRILGNSSSSGFCSEAKVDII